MISAIVPVHGPSPFLERCVRSLLPQVHEVVIVEDGSPEPPNPFASLEETHYVRRQENGGFGAACNTGAEGAHSKGDWLLFVNSDVELLPDCVRQMKRACSRHNVIVGAKLLYSDDTIQHGGVVYDPNTGWCDHRYRFQPRDYAPAGATEPCLVTGALLLIPRSLFWHLGGFDESLRMAWEDIDLELRALKERAQVIYQGQAEAYHIEGGTRGRTPEEKAERGPQWAEWEDEAWRKFHERWPAETLAKYAGVHV